jgi:hypothetical protein
MSAEQMWYVTPDSQRARILRDGVPSGILVWNELKEATDYRAACESGNDKLMDVWEVDAVDIPLLVEIESGGFLTQQELPASRLRGPIMVSQSWNGSWDDLRKRLMKEATT